MNVKMFFKVFAEMSDLLGSKKIADNKEKITEILAFCAQLSNLIEFTMKTIQKVIFIKVLY